jgi:GTP-binding protein HflX
MMIIRDYRYRCKGKGKATKLYGNTTGLKASEEKRLLNLYRRRMPADRIVTPEFARTLTELSAEINRQICALIDRKGTIQYIIIGTNSMVVIPDISRFRMGDARLRGLRSIHTHLKGEPLSRDDLADLALLRLDLIAALGVKGGGLPGDVYVAHLVAENGSGDIWKELEPVPVYRLETDFTDLISSIEDEFVKKFRARRVKVEDGAILVGAYYGRGGDSDDSLAELKELCATSGLTVLDTVVQRRDRPDPKWVIGKGKLFDMVVRAQQVNAGILVFDGELEPDQIRTITDFTEMRIIDRTQVILDIFARRAVTRQGKIQVELAQLKYLLPRLITKNTAMSRLTGGIGGRGPGETKLEINRRHARDRINRLEREIKQIGRERGQQRSQRMKRGLPIISIIGYTNAGKSTLLNTLTKSNVDARDMLFATLDPSSRRLRFPRDFEVIITDTVGFIRNLPKDLVTAFSATLDELKNADLLVHVVDASDPRYPSRIEAVEKILGDLGLSEIPVLMVFNKVDLVGEITVAQMRERHDGVFISAVDSSTLMPLIDRLERQMLVVLEHDQAAVPEEEGSQTLH